MRDVFNRILLLLLGLAALVGGAVGLLLLGGIVTPAQVSPGGILLPQWRFLTQLHNTDATNAAITCAVLIVIGIILVSVELLQGPREPAALVVRQDGLGTVSVARSSIRDLVRYEAASVQGVMDTRQAVSEGRKGLHIRLRASLSPEAAAPEVGRILQEKTREVVQRHIGLPVEQVQILTQIEPLERHGHRRVR